MHNLNNIKLDKVNKIFINSFYFTFYFSKIRINNFFLDKTLYSNYL